MIVLVARYYVQTGKGDLVEAALRRMAPLVQANEPGCRTYQVCRSNDNPVYYIQYAHARICSVFRQLEEKSLRWDRDEGAANLARLNEAHEKSLMTTVSRYSEVIELAATNRAPQHLVNYLREVANEFHAYYNAHTFIVDDAALRNARLALIAAARSIFASGLAILGVSAPESM